MTWIKSRCSICVDRMFYFHLDVTASFMQNMRREPNKGETSPLWNTRKAWAHGLDSGDSDASFAASVLLLNPASTTSSASQERSFVGTHIWDTSSLTLAPSPCPPTPHTHAHPQTPTHPPTHTPTPRRPWNACGFFFFFQQSFLHNYVWPRLTLKYFALPKKAATSLRLHLLLEDCPSSSLSPSYMPAWMKALAQELCLAYPLVQYLAYCWDSLNTS